MKRGPRPRASKRLKVVDSIDLQTGHDPFNNNSSFYLVKLMRLRANRNSARPDSR
jgi:hypothetical protein